MDAEKSQFNLDMNAEVSQRSAQPASQPVDNETSTEIAARIGELMRQQGINEEMNPMAAEKIRRDLLYQRQVETLPQPDGAPPPTGEPSRPELDRLEQLQSELEATRAEATRWKKEFGRREGKVGGMEQRIKELESRVSQVQPQIDVRAITGRQPDEPVTAQDVVNLLMSQSAAFGNTIRQVREEMMNAGNSSEPGLPLDMEAELVESHPWLTDLPRPQKLRAMQDILASAGVTVTPPSPNSAQAARPTNSLPEAAKTPVRQVSFIEPSNRGSVAERTAIAPERQVFNQKVSELNEALSRQGGSAEAAKILASLGAGAVDDTQPGYTVPRRR